MNNIAPAWLTALGPPILPALNGHPAIYRLPFHPDAPSARRVFVAVFHMTPEGYYKVFKASLGLTIPKDYAAGMPGTSLVF